MLGDTDGLKRNDAHHLADKIIETAKKVHLSVGSGFSEEIYERELAERLKERKLSFTFKPIIKVKYDDFKLSGQKVDFIVEESVLVDVICKDCLPADGQDMLLNLHVTGKKVGLVINFGKVEFEHNVVHAEGKGLC